MAGDKERALGDAAKHPQRKAQPGVHLFLTRTHELKAGLCYGSVLIWALGSNQKRASWAARINKERKKISNISLISGFPIYTVSLITPYLIPIVAQKLDWVVRKDTCRN